MKYQYHLIIIGAGSAGLVAASGAAYLGAKVALIEKDLMGGDCLNYGCVPSKSFLKATHLAKKFDTSSKYGLDHGPMNINFEQITNYVSKVISEIQPHDSKERFEKMGVDVYQEKGVFVDRHTIQIGSQQITGRNIIIATGASPFVPPIKGLDQVDYLTNLNVFKLKTQPKKLIIIGAGPIGCELGQGFQHIGTQVTMINGQDKIFSKEDDFVSETMTQVFQDDGICLYNQARISSVTKEGQEYTVTFTIDDREYKVHGDQLLLAAGRRPNIKSLNLDQVGVKHNKNGFILTDKTLRTSVSNIYACGDVTGPFQFTHTAGYQASVVVQNTLFPIKKKANYDQLPWVTFTSPEVAHLGYTVAQAQEQNIKYKSLSLPFRDNDRVITEDGSGSIQVVLDSKDRLIGATLVCQGAGELLASAALAIANKEKISTFLKIMYPYPSKSEIFKTLALNHTKSKVKSWQMNLLKKFIQ